MQFLLGMIGGTPRPGLEVSPTLRLVRPIGAGGMGSVWCAEDRALEREVAVKFLSDHLARDARWGARLRREAIAASRIKSPHVVRVFDHGTGSDGQPYIVMELLEGRSLASHLDERGALSAAETMRLARQIAHALREAHRAGIVHRDIKPSNVFVCDGSDGPFVKLLDFGIAKLAAAGDGATVTGSVVGTPLFMSPEQLIGRDDVDHRADIWAFGILVFRVLTGAWPWPGSAVGELAVAIHTRRPLRASRLDRRIPIAFDRWFARTCAVARERRPEDMETCIRALAEALGEPTTDRGAPPNVSFDVEPSAHPTETLTTAHDAPAQRSGRWRRVATAGVLAVAVASAGGLAIGWMGKHTSPVLALTEPISETAGGLPAPMSLHDLHEEASSPPENRSRAVVGDGGRGRAARRLAAPIKAPATEPEPDPYAIPDRRH